MSIQMNIQNSTKKFALSLCSLLMLQSPLIATAQTYLETYGQNRVQYRKFDWKVFETNHCRIYHYDRSGKDLARYVAEEAENEINIIEKTTGAKPKDKVNIIVYNAYDDYLQNNIGRSAEALKYRATQSGSVDMPNNKFVVYFTGIHTDLQEQVTNGLSTILLDNQLKGNNLKQQTLSAAKMNIPQWLQDGYLQYAAQGWNEHSDKAWKSIVETYPKKKFYALSEINGTLTGQAFWKYIAEKYNKNEVKQLLAAFKNRNNINKALKTRYHLNVVQVFDSCLAFYKDAFSRDAAHKELRDSKTAVVSIAKPKDNSIIRNIKVSPRGADVAYVKWKEGEFKVCLKHTIGEQQEAVILEGGEKNYNEPNDPNYPLMTWSNTGYKMAILYKKGPGLRLRIYDATKGKVATYVVPNNRFDRALGMAIDEDNDAIILSAIRKSQTDLYHFSIKGAKMRNITNDVWDDVQPTFVTGGRKRGIMFMSNRPKANMNVPSAVNELPTGPMNVFFYDTKTKNPALFRCSDVAAGVKIDQPIQFGPDNFAYITDEKGTRNKYVVVFGRDKNNRDSAYWTAATNLSHSLNNHQYNPAGNLVADVIEQDGAYNVYVKSLQIPNSQYPAPLVDHALLVEEDSAKIGMSPIPNAPKREKRSRRNPNNSYASNSVQLNSGNDFQSEFAQRTTTSANTNFIDLNSSSKDEKKQEEADSSFIKMKPQPYRVGFRPNSISVSLDNNLLFNRYQSASQNGYQYANPSLAGLVTFSMDDMLENYRLVGGIRLPLGNAGATYFVQFENAKRRLDWSLAFVRSSNTQQYNLVFTDTLGNPLFSTLGIGKTNTNLLQATGSYPIDRMRSIRFQTALRQDVLNFKSIDTFNLIVNADKKYWSMSRLEFVYDNTKSIMTNILNGTRYKVFGEYMMQMNGSAGSVYNFGFDFRTYQKLYKNLIWAFRVAGAHSGGKQKVLYFLGGVDNWLNYQRADYVPINQESYGFQTVANTLRGYKQQARNGNSYALANSELRYPILSSLIHRPIQSKILRSLQVIAFADAGLAWNGLIPNDQNMSKNYVLQQNPVTVSVAAPNVSSIAFGYGMGMRVAVSGYQLRLDAAWNKEGIKTPIIYWSIGTDF